MCAVEGEGWDMGAGRPSADNHSSLWGWDYLDLGTFTQMSRDRDEIHMVPLIWRLLMS